MLNRNKKKVSIPFSIAVLLICLLMFSLYLTSGMLARYTTTATAGDKARAAKFDVGATGSTGTMAFVYTDGKFAPNPADSNVYTLTVTNKSEVAVRYNVVIENVPAYITATVGETVYSSDENGKITIAALGELAANTTANGVMTITFNVTDGCLDTLEQTDSDTLVAKDQTIEFDAIIKIVQID